MLNLKKYLPFRKLFIITYLKRPDHALFHIIEHDEYAKKLPHFILIIYSDTKLTKKDLRIIDSFIFFEMPC